MPRSDRVKLKESIKRRAKAMDINMLGIAPVERWEQEPHQSAEFWPQNIWPWSRNVIVMGMQIMPSMIETTPSVVYSELYNTTNRLLDNAAYRIANFLNEAGYRAHFFPRDCYGDISALVKRPEAAFSQVLAGLYAGLGTVGRTLCGPGDGWHESYAAHEEIRFPYSAGIGDYRCGLARRPDDKKGYLCGLSDLCQGVPAAGLFASAGADYREDGQA